MALTTKSGALWQMSRAEKDEGWTDEGHAFVGREVVRSTSATAQSVGTIYCWLPPTVEDCYEDEDGKPAPLFKVRFLVGELDGDVEDLDIRQVVESLVHGERPAAARTSEAEAEGEAQAAGPIRRGRRRLRRRRAGARVPEDDEASDYEAEARKPAAKKRKAASPPKPAKKAPASANPRRSQRHRSPRRRPRRAEGQARAGAGAEAEGAREALGAPGRGARATARYAWEPLRDNQLALAAGDNLEVWPTNESWWFCAERADW